MLRRLWTRLDEAERRWRRSFGKDISTPRARALSFWHYNWLDHAHVRRLFWNQYRLAPGVWRANQPTLYRLRRLRDRHGLKTVLNLRGEDVFAHHLFLEENCARLGLTLISVKLQAKRASKRENYLAVLEALRTAERPLLIHCKSGADRTGIVSALYLMIHEGVPVETARKQLSLKYHHIRRSEAGVLDYILDVYAEENAREPIDIETWFATRYDAARINAGFQAGRLLPPPPMPAPESAPAPPSPRPLPPRDAASRP